MRKKTSIVYVDQGFKAILKAEAALNGLSVVDFTKKVAKDEVFISEYLNENKKSGLRRKNGFGFKF